VAETELLIGGKWVPYVHTGGLARGPRISEAVEAGTVA
jgi:hypothetical protein